MFHFSAWPVPQTGRILPNVIVGCWNNTLTKRNVNYLTSEQSLKLALAVYELSVFTGGRNPWKALKSHPTVPPVPFRMGPLEHSVEPLEWDTGRQALDFQGRWRSLAVRIFTPFCALEHSLARMRRGDNIFITACS
ncbi:hypothetical protein BR93DRAFT_922838 [Coniochaeta sp. PMI_546]|nr:hypothetical protein BR93DRAFT_922838 [Coniochaeta sp. PMI_546]